MKMNPDTLRTIEEQARTESDRYANAISVIRDLASAQAITWQEVERIEQAAQPFRDKANAISAAAHHALTYALSSSQPRLPFAPAPVPTTAEEDALLEQAWNDYFNI